MNRYDCIIVGSGPAGLEAAVNLSIRGKSFLLFGNDNLSIKLETAPRIDNYLGLPGISGRELQRRYREHLASMNIQLQTEQVNLVYPMGDYFSVATNKDTYQASTVILATGTSPVKLLPGEERLLGRGVGYCATCDAPLYRGKTVAVVGWSDEAVLEANFVAELAKTVYYLPVRKYSQTLRENIHLLTSPPVEILGEHQVEALKTKTETIAVDGVFLLRDSIAPSSLVPGIQVENGFISVDSDMQTNLPGCFAAGDCTGKPHQLMRAAGQGQTAALSVTTYLDRKAAQS
ncbi:MAG: NAD(P)/FAD-dependent oxidoreductase [Oscillospiraceae bacterium]|jgi:thioredoxin reductase (NADPH)